MGNVCNVGVFYVSYRVSTYLPLLVCVQGFFTLAWPATRRAIFTFPTWRMPGLFSPWKFFKVS